METFKIEPRVETAEEVNNRAETIGRAELEVRKMFNERLEPKEVYGWMAENPYFRDFEQAA